MILSFNLRFISCWKFYSFILVYYSNITNYHDFYCLLYFWSINVTPLLRYLKKLISNRYNYRKNPFVPSAIDWWSMHFFGANHNRTRLMNHLIGHDKVTFSKVAGFRFIRSPLAARCAQLRSALPAANRRAEPRKWADDERSTWCNAISVSRSG